MQAVGNGMLLPGSSSVNLGTSGQVFVASDRPLYDSLLRTHTFCHAPADSWYVMGAMLNACLAANWFNGSVCASDDYWSMHDGAAQVAPGCSGLIFLPYLTGERTPHMNENARGAFIGLTIRHDHNRGRCWRAWPILCGTAWRSCAGWACLWRTRCSPAAVRAARSGGRS